jgi:hypothetical protein
MSSYTIYDPNQALEQSRQRRQMAMQRLMQMQQAKQAYTNEQQRLLEKQQKEMEAAQQQRVHDEQRMWGGSGWGTDAAIGGVEGALSGAVTGGMIGMAGGPVTALGGAIAGGLGGLAMGAMKGGKEAWEAKQYGKFAKGYEGPSPMAVGTGAANTYSRAMGGGASLADQRLAAEYDRQSAAEMHNATRGADANLSGMNNFNAPRQPVSCWW